METIVISLMEAGEITAGETLNAVREYGSIDISNYIGETGISIAPIAEATLNHLTETGVVTQSELLSVLHKSGKIDVRKLLVETSHNLVDAIWAIGADDEVVQAKQAMLNNYIDMRGDFDNGETVYNVNNIL